MHVDQQQLQHYHAEQDRTGDPATEGHRARKPALRQTDESARLTDSAENMAMDSRIASRVLTRPDFAEGVRAVIVDKTNDPKWNPATPEEVSDELIESIFAPLPQGGEWKPLV